MVHVRQVRLLGLLAFVMLAGLVPYSVVHWHGTTATHANIVLGLMIVVYAAGRLSWTLCQPDGRFMSVICFVFIYVFVGIASLAQVVDRHFPTDNRNYTAAAVTHQLVILAIGCLALELGLQLGDRRRTGTRAKRAPRMQWTFSPTRAALLGVVGLAFVARQVAMHGVLAFFVSRQQTVAFLAGVAPEDQPYYTDPDKVAGLLSTAATQYFVFVSLLVILYSRHHRIWRRSGPYAEPFWRVLIGLLVAANIIMNNPMGNARIWFCLVLVTLVSVYVSVRKPANLVLYTAGALLVLLFAFTYLDAFRTTGPATTIIPHDLASSESYPVFQMGLNGDEYVATEGHTHGRQFLGSALEPIPRRYWPNKPIATGQLVDTQYDRSASAWTEMYVDFGTAGVVVFFVLYGFGVRTLERHSYQAPPGALTALIPAIGTYQLFLLRGSFLPAVGTGYQLLFLVLFVSSLRLIRPATDVPDAQPELVAGRPDALARV